jgi:hypothetical protein
MLSIFSHFLLQKEGSVSVSQSCLLFGVFFTQKSQKQKHRVRNFFLSQILLLFPQIGFCQSEPYIDWNSETWWGLMSSTRVSDRWSIYADLHYSRQLFVAPRAGITFHPKDNNFVTTVAYAFLSLSTPFSEGRLIRSEHRPWMQMVYRVPSKRRVSASFRFKYDMRFIRDVLSDQLVDGFSLNHRWRFNNAVRFHIKPAIKKPSYSVVLINEALITTGPGPNGVPYEHRTHFMGEISKRKLVLSVGGMVRYLGKTPNGIRMTIGPVVWLTMNLNFSQSIKNSYFENPEDHIE